MMRHIKFALFIFLTHIMHLLMSFNKTKVVWVIGQFRASASFVLCFRDPIACFLVFFRSPLHGQ